MTESVDVKRHAGAIKNVVVPSVLALIFAIAFNIFLYNQEVTFFKTSYDNEVAGTKSLLEGRMQSALVAAATTASFFTSTKSVSFDEFNSFASVITERISTGEDALPTMVEWVDAHNVIRYVYPLEGATSTLIGLDMNAFPNRLAPIVKAKETKAPVVSEPLMFVEGYPGLLVYSPIFRGSDYLGSIIVAVRMKNFLAPLSGSNPVYSKNVYLETGNYIIPFDDDVVLNTSGERVTDSLGSTVFDPRAQEYASSTAGVLSQDIIFADKTWQLRLSPAYLGEVYKRVSYYMGASLLFVVVFCIFLWMIQKSREKSAQETARTRALVLSIGDGLVATDKKGIITFANKKAEELSGYSAEEVIGKSYLRMWNLSSQIGTEVSDADRPFTLALTKKEVTHISTASHMTVLRKDGSRLPLSATISPIIVNGQIDGAIAVFTDITKETEVDRMKSEFLSLASHQLLTPISATKWLAEVILAGDCGPLTDKQIEYIHDIQTSAKRMGELVNSLLNISRIESGRLMIVPEPTQVADLAQEVIKEVKVKSDARKQTIEIKVADNLPKINIDPHLVREIYKNFLTNAIKYSPEKDTISVEIQVVENDIVSSVTDHGYGIPKAQQDKVFQKFYRGDNILQKEMDGNGLGLYLVKQIVEASGGKAWFESEENKGTTFWFSLPLSGSVAKAGEVSIT